MTYKSRVGSGNLVSVAMLAITCLLAAVSVAKVARVFVVSSRLEQITKTNGIVAAPTQEQVEKAIASSRAIADGLKRSNLFIPAPSMRNPVEQVYAIMGDEVLINGRWYKAGDRVADANIVAVEPTRVVIEWNGQRINLSPIQAAIEGQEGSGRPGMRGGRGGRGGPIGSGGPMITQVGGPAGGGPGMFGFSQQDIQRVMNMTPEQRRSFIMERIGQFGGMGPMGGMRGGGFGGRGGDQGQFGGGGRGGQQGGAGGGRGGRQGGGGGR